MPDLQGERLSLILTADTQDMVAELFPEKIQRKLTVLLHMHQDMLQKISLHQAWLRNVNLNLHMPLALPNQFQLWLIPLVQAKFLMMTLQFWLKRILTSDLQEL